jgi:hypothetical protein
MALARAYSHNQQAGFSEPPKISGYVLFFLGLNGALNGYIGGRGCADIHDPRTGSCRAKAAGRFAILASQKSRCSWLRMTTQAIGPAVRVARIG